MTAGRDPVDRVVDLAIALPVSTLIAARRTLPIIALLARRRNRGDSPVAGPLAPVGGDLEREAPGPTEPRSTGRPAAAPAARARGRANGGGSGVLPLDGYDHLAARQVVDRLAGLDADELDAVERYELAHRRRRTVLGKIEQLRS